MWNPYGGPLNECYDTLTRMWSDLGCMMQALSHFDGFQQSVDKNWIDAHIGIRLFSTIDLAALHDLGRRWGEY